MIVYKSATFSLDINGYNLLFIGTDINSEDKLYKTQYISKNDLELIKNDFEINKDEQFIIFSHLGIANDINIKDNFLCYSENGENLMLRNRRKLKKLMKEKNLW